MRSYLLQVVPNLFPLELAYSAPGELRVSGGDMIERRCHTDVAVSRTNRQIQNRSELLTHEGQKFFSGCKKNHPLPWVSNSSNRNRRANEVGI